MKTQAKKLKWNMILMSAIYMALGIVLLMWPEAVKSVICYVIGGIVMLAGAVQVIRFLMVKDRIAFAPMTLIFGVVCLALGAFLVMRSDIVWTVLPIVFGLFVIFDSVLRLQNALELKRSEAENWWIFLLLALLSVVLGVVMIYDPFGSTDVLIMAIGVILLIESALNLISSLYTFAVVRRFVKSHPAAEAVAEALSGKDLNGDGMVAAPAADATVEGTATERDAEDEETQQPSTLLPKNQDAPKDAE